MKRLSNRQEQVMAILWKYGPMTISKIVPIIDSNLHYNTISTVVRELDKLGYITHNEEFRPYIYYPIISKDDYLKELFDSILKRFFYGNKENLIKNIINNFN